MYEQMVLALMSPDNNLRNQAEEAFNMEKNDPNMLIRGLLHLLRNNSEQQVGAADGVAYRPVPQFLS